MGGKPSCSTTCWPKSCPNSASLNRPSIGSPDRKAKWDFAFSHRHFPSHFTIKSLTRHLLMPPQRSRPLKACAAERHESLDSPHGAGLDAQLAWRAGPLLASGRWTRPPTSIHPAGVDAGARLPASPAVLRPLLGTAAWSHLRTTRQDARVSTCPVTDRPRLELFRPGSRESRAR